MLIRSTNTKTLVGDGTTDIDISQFANVSSDGSVDFGALTPGATKVMVSNGGQTLQDCPDENNVAVPAVTPPNGKFFIPPTAFCFSRVVIRTTNAVTAAQFVYISLRG